MPRCRDVFCASDESQRFSPDCGHQEMVQLFRTELYLRSELCKRFHCQSRECTFHRWFEIRHGCHGLEDEKAIRSTQCRHLRKMDTCSSHADPLALWMSLSLELLLAGLPLPVTDLLLAGLPLSWFRKRSPLTRLSIVTVVESHTETVPPILILRCLQRFRESICCVRLSRFLFHNQLSPRVSLEATRVLFQGA